MQPLMRTMAARVTAGARLLDVHLPGWMARVDPNRLDAGSRTGSVLGQLRDQTVSVSGLCAVLMVDQAAHGFALHPTTDSPEDHDDTDHDTPTDTDAEPETPSGAAELTAAWHAEITRRAATPTDPTDASRPDATEPTRSMR